MALRAVRVTVMSPTIYRTARSDTVRPLLSYQEIKFCFVFFTLFSLIRHTLQYSILAMGNLETSVDTHCGERGVPAGTHFVSWLKCYPNSPGHSAPQITLNWFFQLVLYISYRVLYYFPHRAFLLMVPKQADKNSIFPTEIFMLLRLSLTIITSWKMQWSMLPEYFYIKMGT